MEGTATPSRVEGIASTDAGDPSATGVQDAVVVVPDTIPEDLLSPAPAAPSAAPPATGAPAPTAGLRHASLTAIFGQYGTYVALFVGAGLISGSVVHFPLAPLRYAIIGGAGAAIFAVASVLAERAGKDALGIARLAVASLALALGIGMISGSIQHFQDIPDRAVRLIPIGLALSAVAFIARNGLRPRKDDVAVVALWTVVAVVALGLGLGQLADRVGTPGGGHGDAQGAAAQGKGSKETGKASSESEAGGVRTTKSAQTTDEPAHGDDGHGH